MLSVVYQAQNKINLEQRPAPIILKPTDALVRVQATSICRTDLRILEGHLPTVLPGRILGHEGIGIVEQVGSKVLDFQEGDAVIISHTTACGHCEFCSKRMYANCSNGGWLLGNSIDGTQAEYVRIPHADFSLHKIEDFQDKDSLVLCSDVFPTGLECGIINSGLQSGDSLLIMGAGPIGLAILLLSRFYSPLQTIVVDSNAYRLQCADSFGASKTLETDASNIVQEILKTTLNRGVDRAIDAQGSGLSFNICESVIAAGGTIANLGVYAQKIDFHLNKLYAKNIKIVTKLVDTYSIPHLLKFIAAGKLQPRDLISHEMAFKDILGAYQLLQTLPTQALKILIKM